MQGVPPPPKPPRLDPSFINDDNMPQGHQEMDATPPIAAKAVKKSARKRTTSDSSAPEQVSEWQELCMLVKITFLLTLVVQELKSL